MQPQHVTLYISVYAELDIPASSGIKFTNIERAVSAAHTALRAGSTVSFARSWQRPAWMIERKGKQEL